MLQEVIHSVDAEKIPVGETKLTMIEALVRTIYRNALKGDMRASEFIAVYGHGKPAEQVSLAVSMLSQLPPEELAAIYLARAKELQGDTTHRSALDAG